jgi:Tol biopolymer transport system component
VRRYRGRLTARTILIVGGLALAISLIPLALLIRASRRESIGSPLGSSASFTESAAKPSMPGRGSFEISGMFAIMAHENGAVNVRDSLYVAAKEQPPRELVSSVNNYLSRASWSPDGSRVVLGRAIEPYPTAELIIVDVTSGTTTLLTDFDLPQYSAWSPLGDAIAFSTQHGHVYVIAPDGTGLRQVTDPGQWCTDGRPEWAPDGTQLVFVRDCSDTPDEAENGMYVVQANGTDLHRISSDPSTGRLAWSPDGTTIAYTRHVRDETSSSLYLISADGSGRHELAPGATSPSWSADGLVLAAVRDGQVIFLDLEGNQLASLDAPGLHASWVTWAYSG